MLGSTVQLPNPFSSLNSIVADRHQFRERNLGRGRVHVFLLEVDISQDLTGGITLVDQHVEHRRKFGRFVDALADFDDRTVLRVGRGAARAE
jgi:hypothetical protein